LLSGVSFQAVEKNTEAELERMTRSSKQMTDQLHATHANDLRAVEKRLKTDEVSFGHWQIYSCFYF